MTLEMLKDLSRYEQPWIPWHSVTLVIDEPSTIGDLVFGRKWEKDHDQHSCSDTILVVVKYIIPSRCVTSMASTSRIFQNYGLLCECVRWCWEKMYINIIPFGSCNIRDAIFFLDICDVPQTVWGSLDRIQHNVYQGSWRNDSDNKPGHEIQSMIHPRFVVHWPHNQDIVNIQGGIQDPAQQDQRWVDDIACIRAQALSSNAVRKQYDNRSWSPVRKTCRQPVCGNPIPGKIPSY